MLLFPTTEKNWSYNYNAPCHSTRSVASVTRVWIGHREENGKFTNKIFANVPTVRKVHWNYQASHQKIWRRVLRCTVIFYTSTSKCTDIISEYIMTLWQTLRTKSLRELTMSHPFHYASNNTSPISHQKGCKIINTSILLIPLRMLYETSKGCTLSFLRGQCPNSLGSKVLTYIADKNDFHYFVITTTHFTDD